MLFRSPLASDTTVASMFFMQVEERCHICRFYWSLPTSEQKPGEINSMAYRANPEWRTSLYLLDLTTPRRPILARASGRFARAHAPSARDPSAIRSRRAKRHARPMRQAWLSSLRPSSAAGTRQPRRRDCWKRGSKSPRSLPAWRRAAAIRTATYAETEILAISLALGSPRGKAGEAVVCLRSTGPKIGRAHV